MSASGVHLTEGALEAVYTVRGGQETDQNQGKETVYRLSSCRRGGGWGVQIH